MPRSFLIKKQSDQMEDIHAMSVQQEESCETGTQKEYDPVRKAQHFGVKIEMETEQTEDICSNNTTNLPTTESQSGQVKGTSDETGGMGTTRVTGLQGAHVTPDQSEHENKESSVSPIRNLVKVENGLDNESPDGEPTTYFNGPVWAPNPEVLAAGSSHTTSYHGFYDNTIKSRAPSPFCSPRPSNPSRVSFELAPFCSFHDNHFHHQTAYSTFAPHGNSSISRSDDSYVPLWQNRARITSNDPFLYSANQKLELEQPARTTSHFRCSPNIFPARPTVPLCTPLGGGRSAFRPYTHSNMRYSGQHSQWNEPILKASLEHDGAAEDTNTGNDKNNDVPNCNNAATIWYNTQQDAYSETKLRKALAFPEEIKSGYFQTGATDIVLVGGKSNSAICADSGNLATQSNNEEKHITTPPNKPEKPKKKYPCDICGRSFSRSSTLTTHRRIHSGEKPFVCHLCGRAFRQPGNLSRHRLTHTTAKPYVCVHCNKAFNRASNLHTHMRTHTDYKPFACEFCGKRFHQKVDMKIHRYTHTGEKPHKCQKCGRGFKQLTHLTYHMRTHSEERMYHCTYCGKGFNQKGNMQAHIYRHTGERPFKCDTCGKGFTLASTLNTHKRTHAAHKPFQCELCDKAFYQRNGLKTHYIASHPFSAGMSLL